MRWVNSDLDTQRLAWEKREEACGGWWHGRWRWNLTHCESGEHAAVGLQNKGWHAAVSGMRQ